MNITIERLFEKIGRLHLSQDLLMEENAALKAVKEALTAEIAKIEKDAESLEEVTKGYAKEILDRIKKFV